LAHIFYQFIRAQYWQKITLPSCKMVAKTKFASLWQMELGI